MKKIRILPRKETMIVIYPLVAAQYIIYHHENGLYMPTIFLFLLALSTIVALGMGIKIVINKFKELKTNVNEKRGN